jgi:predicted acylesterase/phospholipase RssA
MSFILLTALTLFNSVPLPDSTETDTCFTRIGITLSGGAAFGLAHIGVLKVLEREGFHACCITGNSMGSLVGGLYAAGYSATELESIAVNADFNRLFSSSIPYGAQYLPERQRSQRYIVSFNHRNFIPDLPAGLISLQNTEFLLMRLLSEIEYNTYYDFDSLPIPYRTVAVDLISGDLIVLKKGRLQKAIRASIAIPGVFSPESIDSLELVDGGVQRFLPAEELTEFRPDIIIASITRKKHEEKTGIKLIDVISRTMDLINLNDVRKQIEYADVVIRPDVDPFLASNFQRVRELITAGEQAAEEMLPEIRRTIAQRRPMVGVKTVKKRPKPTIASVGFEGLQLTRTSILWHLIETKEGTTLDFQRLIDDMENLYNTGLFLNINYRIESIDEETVRVVFEIKEQDYGFYSLGIKYDNADDILLGLAVGQGNLWGSGASIRGVVNIGNPREIRFGLNGTRFFGFPFGYRIDIYRGSIERAYYETSTWQGDYKNDYYGSVAEIGYILGHDAFFDIGFNVKNVRYQMPALPMLDTLPEHEWIIGPKFRLEFNNFNDLQVPSSGTALAFDAQYSSKAIKATNEFLRLDFSLEHYTPLSSRIVLHSGLGVGMSFGALSWSEHFYTDPLRLVGFGKEEYTTMQISSLHFGLDLFLSNLLGQKDYPFYVRLLSNVSSFMALGDLLETEDILSQLHWGVGVGIKANTPIGPFQLIVGANNIAAQILDDISVNYHISIGREFRYTR